MKIKDYLQRSVLPLATLVGLFRPSSLNIILQKKDNEKRYNRKNLEQLIKISISPKILRPFVGLGTLVSILSLGCGSEPKDSPPEPDYECIFNYDCEPDENCVNGQCTPLYSTSASKPDIYSAKKDVTENSACPTKYFEDKDGDGYGDYKAWTCDSTLGIDDNSDCNDYDSLVHPGASDYCGGDGIDNNCNGKVDEEGISHYYEECYTGKKYWFDSCGKKEEIIETCIGNTNCITTCVGNEVHWQNECGGIEEKVKACSTNEACIDGVCVCQPGCKDKECGDDGCGGSCGSCSNGYECKETQYSSKCECVDCGGLCCFEDGKECLEDLYSKDYLCMPKGSTICKSVYGENLGYCPSTMICVGYATCCLPDKPYFHVIFKSGDETEFCCETKYQWWIGDGPQTTGEALEHCDWATEMMY